LEETTTVETLGDDAEVLRGTLAQVASEPLGGSAFRRVAVAAVNDTKQFDALTSLIGDWDAVAPSLGDKDISSVLHGYCLLLVGRRREAEGVLKEQAQNPWGLYHYIGLLLEEGRVDEALPVARQGLSTFKDTRPVAFLAVEALARAGEFDDAAKLIEELEKTESEVAGFHYAKGQFHQRSGDYREAIESYQRAVAIEETHQQAFFHLGYLLDLYGNDAEEANDEAIEAYEKCVQLDPVHRNAVVNLGLLYEDRERYHDSVKCYETVLRCYPNHQRVKMYLGDAHAATRMFYDKDQEKKADRQSQVLKIPVTDFELSVRSRNCLQKMNIMTLGDLIMKTEQELLSYKNFGETSLEEIKVMLNQKGLRLGQGLEEKAGDQAAGRNPLEATASPEILNRSIDELDLSVRSRRCMERLGVRNVRELINQTEVDLMAAKNFGMTSLNEIKRKLTELGLSLRA